MAQVLELNGCNPIKDESYFIDTNVWYWATYVTSKDMALPNQPHEYQVRDYPQFLERALSDGAILCHCSMTLAELANIIENAELELYKRIPGNEYVSKKEFRNNTDARKDVLNEIKIAWNTINKISNCIDVGLNYAFTKDVINIMTESNVDSFDAFYVQIMRENKIDYIVTDDHDFSSVNQQIVVTSNRKALR